MGFEGKPVGFLCTVAPYYEPGHRRSEREMGKQIQCTWPKTGLYFGKLTYAPEAYVEAAKNKDMPRKFGFGSNKPLDFDDLGSTIEVGRYRHHLALEAKQEAKRSPSPPRKRAGAADQSLRQSGRPPVPLGGLQSTIPKFTSAFDRQRHVQEFSTRRLPADKKFERVNVSLRPVSADIGEGCSDKSLLKTPTYGVGDFVGSSMYNKRSRPLPTSHPKLTLPQNIPAVLSKVHPYVSGTKITIGN